MKIAVAGATGRVGRPVVDVIRAEGHDVVPISRSGGVAKIAHEQAMLAGPVPAFILRAAQFHEFVAQLMDWGRQGEVAYVPKMRTQLVAARTVAEELAAMATSPAPETSGGPIPEIAGPREESLVDMAVLLAARRGDPVKIEGVSSPSDHDVYESGALLPGPHATLAGPTFEQWLGSSREFGSSR